MTIASLLAGLATTPYAAFHFHRVTPYGVVANLLAMPIVSAWVMPMGILGILTMPLGLDAEFWRQMGYGIEWMNAVGLWVASLPGAYGRVSLFGAGPLLLATAGFLLIGLLKTPLRWSGAVAVVAAAIWAVFAPRPDVLIAGDGHGFAVRGNDGRLAIHHTGSDSFAVHEWLAADADGRDVHDKSLVQGIACDASGCIGKLAGGGLVAYALTPQAFEEDCSRAVIVVASRGDPPADCKATVIDRALWRQPGALALSQNGPNHGSEFIIEAARSKNFDRPWSRAPVPREALAASVGESGQGESGSHARDATPVKRTSKRISNHSLDQTELRRHFSRISPRDIRAANLNTAGTDQPACPGCGRGWAEGCEPRRPYWPARARLRRRGAGSA